MSNGNQNNGGNKSPKVERKAIAEVSEKMDARIAEFVEESKGQSASTKAFYLATCIVDLRQIMNTAEVKTLIRALANTPLGFMCDKPNKKDQSTYSDNELLEACCEALIRGYNLTGNEFNIISGRFYAAKNGLQRKVYGLPGLDNFYPDFTIPIKTVGDNRMHVTCKAKFIWQGRPTEMIRTFAVNVFDGPASTDAALGKAERKFLAAVYQKLTNEIIPVADMEELAEGTTETEPRTEAGESKAESIHKQLTAGTTEYVKTPATVEPEKVPVVVQDSKPTEKPAEKQIENKPEEKPATPTKPKTSIFDQIDDEHERALAKEKQQEQLAQLRNSSGK